MENISKVIKSSAVHPDTPKLPSFEKRKQKKHRHSEKARKHFKMISKLVEETHEELENNNSPFRLCVYQEGEDVYIDIVTIDESGEIDQTFKHDISQAELEDLVQNIKSGLGLVLDREA